MAGDYQSHGHFPIVTN